jgi:ATP-dependent Lon protease
MKQETTDKLRRCFESMAVFKDLTQSNLFKTLGLPSFMRDWLLQRFENGDGVFDAGQLQDFVHTFIPKHDDWTGIKDRIVVEFERVKILAKITVNIDVVTGEVSFSLPDFGLRNKETMIDPDVWDKCKDKLVSGHETWGMLELGYRPPDDTARPKIPGKIRLLDFRDFCPYTIDLDYYKDVRKEFSVQEWIDVVLGAVDYKTEGYDIAKANDKDGSLPDADVMRFTVLTRILPFVEKRLNLMELAPMGTGKSYLFGQVSRYGWLSTSDKMTRAKLFYDVGRREQGLVGQNDFIVLDEIQKTVFEDGMGSVLQGYLEQGTFTVGNYSNAADSGFVLCGNIPPETMKQDGYAYMFANLPKVFQDAALIDRFHGFIKGWYIPRMNSTLKIDGWALNSEYFTAILHQLRDDISYRHVVDESIEVPSGSDERDTEAVKRIATALLKLLFPHVRTQEDISEMDFNRYCLRPAMKMRYTIKYQMGLMNEQYRGKDLPALRFRKEM